MGNLAKKILGQSLPTNTSNTVLITNAAGQRTIVQNLVITNVTAGAIAARVFIVDSGTTYDTTTTIGYDFSVPANDFIERQWGFDEKTGLYLEGSAAKLVVRSASGSGLNFAAWGVIEYV